MKWTRLEQNGDLPLARSSHSITAVAGKCYLFGGEHEPRQVICLSHEKVNDNAHAFHLVAKDGALQCRTPIDSRLYEYDLEKSQWAQRACNGETPSPRVAHTAAAVRQSLYMFGGRSGTC